MKRNIVVLTFFMSLISSAISAKLNEFKRNSVVISGTLENGSTGDTVIITVMPFGIDYKFLNYTYYVILNGKSFKQLIKQVNHPMYVNLVFKKSAGQDWMIYHYLNIYNYLIEPGDSIHINKITGAYIFSGTGSKKFELQNKFDSIYFSKRNSLRNDITPEFLQYEKTCDSITKIELDFLSEYKKGLSSQAYQLLYVNLIAIGSIRKQNFILQGPDLIAKALQYLSPVTPYPDSNEFKLIKHPYPIYVYSNFFQDFIIVAYQVDYFKLHGKKPGLGDQLTYIINQFHGLIREKLLCSLLLKNRKNISELGSSLSEASAYVSTAYFKSILNSLSLSRLPGLPGIDFDLVDSSGNRHTLKNYVGRVVVLDFWFTGCSNCIRLNPFLLSLEASFKKENVAFLTISADTKKEIWLKSLRTGLYTTAFSMNLFEDNATDNQSVFKHYNVDNFPTLIVINRSGKLMRNVLDPRVDKGKDLLELIEEGLQETHASAN